MEVYANGQLIPFTLTEEKSLRDVLDTLLLLSNQANKLVVECKVNDEVISLLEKEKCNDVSIDSVQKIELRVENKVQRVIESLQEIETFFPLIIEQFSEVSNSLIAGQKHKAMTVFASALDKWRRIVNFLRVIEATYRLKFAEIEVQGKKIEVANDELFNLLSEIKKAIENEDLVTIGDLVEYELKDKLEEQKNIIIVLQNIIKEESEKLQSQIP